jgi:hypothetical protein
VPKWQKLRRWSGVSFEPLLGPERASAPAMKIG